MAAVANVCPDGGNKPQSRAVSMPKENYEEHSSDLDDCTYFWRHISKAVNEKVHKPGDAHPKERLPTPPPEPKAAKPPRPSLPPKLRRDSQPSSALGSKINLEDAKEDAVIPVYLSANTEVKRDGSMVQDAPSEVQPSPQLPKKEQSFLSKFDVQEMYLNFLGLPLKKSASATNVKSVEPKPEPRKIVEITKCATIVRKRQIVHRSNTLLSKPPVPPRPAHLLNSSPSSVNASRIKLVENKGNLATFPKDRSRDKCELVDGDGTPVRPPRKHERRCLSADCFRPTDSFMTIHKHWGSKEVAHQLHAAQLAATFSGRTMSCDRINRPDRILMDITSPPAIGYHEYGTLSADRRPSPIYATINKQPPPPRPPRITSRESTLSPKLKPPPRPPKPCTPARHRRHNSHVSLTDGTYVIQMSTDANVQTDYEPQELLAVDDPYPPVPTYQSPMKKSQAPSQMIVQVGGAKPETVVSGVQAVVDVRDEAVSVQSFDRRDVTSAATTVRGNHLASVSSTSSFVTAAESIPRDELERSDSVSEVTLGNDIWSLDCDPERCNSAAMVGLDADFNNLMRNDATPDMNDSTPACGDGSHCDADVTSDVEIQSSISDKNVISGKLVLLANLRPLSNNSSYEDAGAGNLGDVDTSDGLDGPPEKNEEFNDIKDNDDSLKCSNRATLAIGLSRFYTSGTTAAARAEESSSSSGHEDALALDSQNNNLVCDGSDRLSLGSSANISVSEDSFCYGSSTDESETETNSEGTFCSGSYIDGCPSIPSLHYMQQPGNAVMVDVGGEADSIPSRRSKAFYIAQELTTSEKVFVDCLRLINEDFRRFIERGGATDSGHAALPEDVLSSLLRHLPQLQNLNEDLLEDLMERIDHWEDIGRISDVIVRKGPFLKLYSAYIKDFESLMVEMDNALKKYPNFAAAAKEFEALEKCGKLAIKHFMLKPVQRLPQYKLLLQDYLRNLPTNSIDYNDTVIALDIVKQVAEHADTAVKQGDNFSKLLSIQNCILGHHEVIKPGRLFLRQGELRKLSRKEAQQRIIILFSDALFYCKPSSQSVPVIFHLHLLNELPLLGMKVCLSNLDDYKTEFSIVSVRRSFTLVASSVTERDSWVQSITDAINEITKRRGTLSTKHSDIEMAFTEPPLGQTIEKTAKKLGNEAPVWVPDTRVTMCQLCTREFTLTFRRHHCRSCGKVVCGECSMYRVPLAYLNFRSARVCVDCFVTIQQDFELTVAVDSDTDVGKKQTSGPESSSDAVSVQGGGVVSGLFSLAHYRRNSKHKKYQRAVGSQGRHLPSVLKVRANARGATVSGYLRRKAENKTKWKLYWFVIKDKVLYTFRASEDVAALESIPLLGFELRTFKKAAEGIDPRLIFELCHTGYGSTFYYSDNPDSSARWIRAVREATVL